MVAETLIESLPPDEIKRGRVLSDTPAAKAARDRRAAAKAGDPGKAPRGRKPGRSRAPRASGRRGAPKTLYPEIAGMIGLLNTVVGVTPIGSVYGDTRSVQPDGSYGKTSHSAMAFLEINPVAAMAAIANGVTPDASLATDYGVMIKLGDELDAAEIELLAKAINAQAERSPRFRKAIERMLGVGAGGQMITAIAMIGARRAARHGLAPAHLDPAIGAMIAGGDLSALAGFTPSPDHETRNEGGELAPIPTPDLDDDAQPPSSFDDL